MSGPKISKKTKIKKLSDVDKWIKREKPNQRKALENASKHFDKDDSLTVNHLQAIYGKESSYGTQRRERGTSGASGDFMFEKATAVRFGLTVTKENDQRFDVDDASAAAAKYLKTIDDSFKEPTSLTNTLKTIAVTNSKERTNFVIAAYNAGEGRIVKAQKLAKKNGKDPLKWDDVKESLGEAGSSKKKVQEIIDYVEKVQEYTKAFSKKSQADKNAKFKKPSKIVISPKGGHWITKNGQHILIGG